MYLAKVIRPNMHSISNHTSLSVHYFLAYAAVGAYNPFLPLYLSSLNLSTLQIGVLYAIVPFVGIFAQLTWGNYADKHNRRKEFLLAVLAGSGVFGFAHSISGSAATIALFIFLFACFFSAVVPLTDSIALQTAPETRSYGLLRRWGSLGYACMSIAAGLTFTIVPLVWFGVITGCAFVVSLIWAIGLPNPNRRMHRARKGFPLGQVLRTPGVLALSVVALMTSTPNGANNAFLGWHLESLGASHAWIGLAWAVSAISEVPVFGWGVKLLGRWPARKLLAVAAAIYVVRWLLYAIIPSYPVIILLQASQGITFGLFFLAAVENLAQLVPVSLYSSSQAILLVVYGLGGIVGSIGGGLLIKHYGFGMMFVSMAVLSAVAFWRLVREQKFM